MTPVCPAHYSCTFSLHNPPQTGPWWEHGAGVAVTVVGIIALAIVLITITYYICESLTQRRRDRSAILRQREDQEHALAIEEQRTMQLDAAKGDPEMLKLVRSVR